MKKSIKWKLTFAFVLLIVCLIGCMLLFNVFFLERFYISEKKNVLIKTYDILDKGIAEYYANGDTLSDLFKKKKPGNTANSESNFVMFLRELQESYNVNIVFMDENNKVYSLFQNSNRFDRRIMNYIFKDAANDRNLKILEKNEKYTIAINEGIGIIGELPSTERGGPTEYYENKGPGDTTTAKKFIPTNIFTGPSRNADIECFGFLSDGLTAFFMVTSVGSIKEPIDLFNRVLVMLSIVILFIGSIAVFVISNNMTSPLLKLSAISKKMSNLEFENKYEDDRTDEIGVLGNSMNEMSDKLKTAIADLKNANIKLQKDLEQKEKLDIMRQEFVANVSHELKTPIALIEGYAEGLMTPGITDNKESMIEYANVIQDETKRMNHIVHSLLDLSSLEGGGSELSIERINLFDIVDGMIKSQEIKITENGIKVDNDIDKGIFVWADGMKLEEVIRNYLTNAINHVDDKKIIKIYTEVISDDMVRLFVYNSGAKLSDENRKKIWEKFYKVDKAHTRTYGGTGLGLSIVKAIADQHKTNCGCVNIDKNDKLEDGMVFYFDLSIR